MTIRIVVMRAVRANVSCTSNPSIWEYLCATSLALNSKNHWLYTLLSTTIWCLSPYSLLVSLPTPCVILHDIVLFCHHHLFPLWVRHALFQCGKLTHKAYDVDHQSHDDDVVRGFPLLELCHTIRVCISEHKRKEMPLHEGG